MMTDSDGGTASYQEQKSPYYEDGQVVIYHGDCLDVLPTLGPAEMIFTSPPYNLGTTTGAGFAGLGHYSDGDGYKGRGGGATAAGKWSGGALADGYADHGDAMPMDQYEDWQRACLSAMWDRCSGAIFYNHKPRPLGELWLPTRMNPGLPVRQIITWARAGGINFAPTHYCPTYEWIVVFARSTWRLRDRAASGIGDVWTVPQESGNQHPSPFPVALPAKAIETARPGSVLDPFMGSGSTLVAAKAAGVPAVGIEKSERYCEMAAKRLAQEVLAL